MTDGLNWGILGTGWIGQRLADALAYVPGANLWSVASRSAERAAWFAEKYGAKKQYTSNEEFAADPALDVVLICTPHPNHAAEAVLCLNAGKHVVCEKPLALNGREVEAMLTAARDNQRFFMEAMWTWFIPATLKARELIQAGEIGEPRLLTADFGFYLPFDPDHRLFNKALGGGSLLDQGVYPLGLALFLFGKPAALSGQAVFGQSEVDEHMAAVLRYADGRLATCMSTLRADSPCEAVISGTEGNLRLHRQFFHSERLSLWHPDKPGRTLDVPQEGNGYNYELAEAMRCIAAGQLESEMMPWQASRDLMSMMDDLRAQWGLRYPTE